MATMNFPDTPAVDEIYTAPNGVQYQWDGSAWNVVSAAAGVPGPQGEPGPEGPQGPAGIGIALKGSVPTIADLPTGAIQGDTYVVEEDGNAYTWSDTDAQYIDIGQIVGPQGPQGIQGEVGPAGADGKPGIDGKEGPQGPAGVDGKDGLPGKQGDVGPQGPQGEVGPQGEQGIAGADGKDGADGATGPQGEQGIAGVDGAQGPKGDTGAEGPQGIQGEVGPKGDVGNTGPQGDVGPAGPKGDQGEIGPAGPQGEAGPKGDQGDQGVPGLGITFQGRVATVADLPATAAQGDMYIVSETGDAWVWANDVGAFENAGPIVGPTGPQGEAGAVGPTGPEGPQGLPGPTAVSADADNTAVLGTDGLLYVSKPTGFLPLAGGTMTGQIVADPATGVKFGANTEIRKGATLTDIALMSGGSTKLNIGSTFSESFTPLKLPLAAPSDNQHAANKKYVDDKVAAGGAGDYVPLTGGDMTGSLGIFTASGFAIKAGKSSTDFYGQYQSTTGQYRLEKGGASVMEWGPTTNQSFKPLLLPADPTLDLQAATKKYVDTKVAAGGGAGAYLPLAGGTMTGAITLPTTVQSLTFGATTYNVFGGSGGIAMRYGGANIATFTATGSTFIQKITTPATGVGLEFGSGGGYLAKVGTGFGLYVGGQQRMAVNDVLHTSSVPIKLPSDPTDPLHAAPKQYVDTKATIVPMIAGGTVPDAANYPNGTLLVEY
jgi:hypothetical protein